MIRENNKKNLLNTSKINSLMHSIRFFLLFSLIIYLQNKIIKFYSLDYLYFPIKNMKVLNVFCLNNKKFIEVSVHPCCYFLLLSTLSSGLIEFRNKTFWKLKTNKKFPIIKILTQHVETIILKNGRVAK